MDNNNRQTVRQEIEAAWDLIWLEPLSGDADVNNVAIAGREEFITRLEKYLTVKSQDEKS